MIRVAITGEVMIFSFSQARKLEHEHESGLAKVCVLIKDRAPCSYYQGLGGKDDFWAEERRTSDFVIPKCNLLGKITSSRELNNSKANNIPGINIGSIFSPMVCTRPQ